MGATNLDRLVLANDLEMVKISQDVVLADFTDGGSTAGTLVLDEQIPAGATVLACVLTTLTGFAGDTSAVIIVGDGSDGDRYMTGTPSVFTTVAGGLDLGVPSGARYHSAAKSVTVTITSAADFTSVSAGAFTIEIYYLT